MFNTVILSVVRRGEAESKDPVKLRSGFNCLRFFASLRMTGIIRVAQNEMNDK
jgi:hypothetical protein